MISAKEIYQSFLHLVFPHVCAGCGSDLNAKESLLCIRCVHDLPATGFEYLPNNPVEKIFWGRVPVEAATAGYYFTKSSLVQVLIHQLKYRGARELGILLGRLLGEQILQSERFQADLLVPLPLFQKRERERGYNQAEAIARGISEATRLPLVTGAVLRPEFTETQTRKGRIERWKNIEGKFSVAKPEAIQGRHLLLIDDVITTGATLESCGSSLLAVPGTSLSIATLCYASR
jgi:ComF family protein